MSEHDDERSRPRPTEAEGPASDTSADRPGDHPADRPGDHSADRSADRSADEEPTQPLRGWASPSSPFARPTDRPEERSAPDDGPRPGSFGAAYPQHAARAEDAEPARYGAPRRPEPGQQRPGSPYGQPQGGRQQYGPSYGQQPGPHAPSGAGSTSETGGWGPPTRPMPAYPAGPVGHHRQPTSRVPGWTWPAVAVLALVLGLVGGALGGAVYDDLASGGGRGPVPEGLAGVETQDAAPLEADNGSIAAVAQALLPSTVQIVASYDGDEDGATGSGFVLDREGHIVTNNHVVAGAAADDGPIRVVDHTGERHEATVVGRSPVYDLAVLEVVDPEAAQLAPAALGASQVLNVGEPVVAFGSPLGLSQTVTAGIVSALDRPVTTGDGADDLSYINAVQTDAAINPGNSGGPLVNLAGEVVGVNSAIATTGGIGGEAGNIGVGFAIPIEQVRTTVDQILRTGEARYPVIGAQVQTGGRSDDGAQITEVVEGTPAARAGLQKDDIVTAVDGDRVTDGISLIVAIRTHLPGETLELTFLRDGEEQTVSVVLDAEVG